jgi:hypothetical protein
MNKIRHLIFYKSYFFDFFNSQSIKVRDKIDYVLYLVTIGERIPKKFFDQVTGLKNYMRLELNLRATFFEYFAALTKEA